MRRSPSTDLTVVVETWPYEPEQIERAALSVADVASRVILLGTDGADVRLAPFDDGLLEWAAVPWQGDFSAWRNRLLATLDTSWVLWLYGHEELVRLDMRALAESIADLKRSAFRLRIGDYEEHDHKPHWDPVRLFPRSHVIRFHGRIHPNISPALTEFGYAIEDLPIRIHRPYGNGVRDQRRQWTPFIAKYWESRLERAPENRVKLAMVYFGAKQWDRAQYWLRESSLAELPDPWVLQREFIEAGLAAQQEDFARARRHLESSLRNHPYSTDLLFLDATVLAGMGRYDEAYLRFVETLARGEDYALYSEPGVGSYLCWRWLARMEAARHRYKEAVKEYLSLLEQYPYYRSAWVELLDLLHGGEPEEIVELLSLVLSKRQILDYLDKQAVLTPVEAEVKNWLKHE